MPDVKISALVSSLAGAALNGLADIFVTVDQGAAETKRTSAVAITQAGLRDGASDLDHGGNAITNVGAVDGRDVSADGAALDSHVADTANPHQTTTQQAVDQQAGAAVNVDSTTAVRLDNDTDTSPVLGLGGTAAAPRVRIYGAAGAVVLELDSAGDVLTPDITIAGGNAEALAVGAGAGGPSEDASATDGGDGGALALASGHGGGVPLGESGTAGDGGDLTITAGSGGAGGFSGTAGAGGDLHLRSGGGPGSEGTGSPGTVLLGAPFTEAQGLPVGSTGAVAIYTGDQPVPSSPAEILIDAAGPLTLAGSSIASGEGSTQWTHDGFVHLTEESSDPSTPGADELALYAKDDGAGVSALYAKDDAGDVHELTNRAKKTTTGSDPSTTITLSDADDGKVIWCTAASTITVTVPDTLSPGFTCELVQGNAGQVQLAAGGSAVLRHPATFNPYTAEQWSSVVVTSLGSNQMLVRGDLEKV